MLRQKHSNSFNRGICDLRRLPNRSPWVDDKAHLKVTHPVPHPWLIRPYPLWKVLQMS
jgi:hypothetical protein